MGGEVPEETPALTLNRLCDSSLQAVVSAAQSIMLGNADVVIVGGAEAMSRSPHAQYSSASIMVRTRVVTAGSAGLGECPFKLIVDLEEHRVTLHQNCPEVVLAIGVVVSVEIFEARNRILDEEQEVEAERLQPWCDHDRAADPVLAKLVIQRAHALACGG
jgi:hypothetical protein